ncbi:phosphatidate cytidylyltransferase [Hyphomicrobium nitrativorans NL23]|uniref:Phosphatidate cytidylyltransferase n=1 Tax=Hyphomicrobium nitrativorans NL23 TaxID=1029756 RepID=V5SFE5_9HYPH|nr:phosphatidate cytidylyltransferase [Hyphomicrobium nitrativorans]AHB49222.1 phosphatidate cytidylyltransferase [Hyphomicrobium nitrativorans NL23]
MTEDETRRAEPEPAIAASGGAKAELGLRIVSALLLGSVSVALAWAGTLPFAALVLAVTLILSWEWAHVVRGDGIDLALGIQFAAAIGAIGLAAFGFAALGVALLLIGTIIVLALEFGERPILSAAGVLYAGLPAVALIWLRSNEPMGFYAVLFILLVVAATDTAAYFAGRSIGGPRLAPSISPKKTWSGLLGGISAAGLTAGAFASSVGAPVLPLAVAGVAMGLVAQTGDLAESALKRAFHLKDASGLLPGHGGFMDRVDGLVPVAVLLALVLLFLDPKAPADALFSGLFPAQR